AGETAEEITDAAGVPIERGRRVSGAGPGWGAARPPGGAGGALLPPRGAPPAGAPAGHEAGPVGPRWGGPPDATAAPSASAGRRPHLAEWIFDPHRKHVAPADDTAARLCLPDAGLPAPGPSPRAPARATVTPIGSRLGPAPDADQGRQAERARVPGPAHA